GDTLLPPSPAAGGSTTAPSVGSATQMAAQEAKRALVGLAIADSRSPLFGTNSDGIELVEGKLVVRTAPERVEAAEELMRRNGYGPDHPHAVERSYVPPPRKAWSMYSFGVQFCEARVDADLGLVRVERLLGVFGVGRVLNAKTARSQLVGGMIQGLGMALLEGTVVDPRLGRFVNASMADYLVPVNADIRGIAPIWVDQIH